MSASTPRYPGRAPIDAYGDGGFRFAEMSHRGSILLLPSGIYAWPPARALDLTLESFAPVIAEARDIELLLIGTGETLVPPLPEVAAAFAERGLGLEVMATGAAARTYNVLLAEERLVAGALIAVDEPC